MQIIQSRRDFLASLSAAGGAAGVLGARGVPRRRGAARNNDNPARETLRHLRRAYLHSRGAAARGGLCRCPLCVAPRGVASAQVTARGEADFLLTFAAPLLIPMDAGEPITVVAGAHVGCFELFANDSVHRIADLKGKSVGVQAWGSSQHVFLASMATYVGLDPGKDINWVTSPSPSRRSSSPRARSMRSLAFRLSRKKCGPGTSAM